MSPDIQHLLSSAADDDGRPPVRTDLEAIRAQGRRAVLRRRVTTGISGLAVAAVVGSVAAASGAIDLRGNGNGGAADDTGFASGTVAGMAPTDDPGSAYSSTMECGWYGESVPDAGTPAPGEAWATGSSEGRSSSFATLTPIEPPLDSAFPPPTADPGHVVFATDLPGASPDSGTVATGAPPSPAMTYGELPPLPTTVEVDPNCGEIAGLDGTPLKDLLGKGGYTAEDAGGLAGTSDAGNYGETIYRVTNAVGQVGSAVIGTYDSIDALPPEDVEGAAWCGPAVSSSATFTWDAACAYDPEVATVTAGHDESATALGGFYIRADGTVVGVSVSTAAYDFDDAPGSEEQLDALPLDADQLAALLVQLADSDTK